MPGLRSTRRRHVNGGARRWRYLDVDFDEYQLVVEVDGQQHMEALTWWEDMMRNNELVVDDRRRVLLRFAGFALRHQSQLGRRGACDGTSTRGHRQLCGDTTVALGCSHHCSCRGSLRRDFLHPTSDPSKRIVTPNDVEVAAPPWGRAPPALLVLVVLSGLEVHTAHATVATRSSRSCLFGLLGNNDLSGEEEAGDRRCVLQRRARDLGRVDDARGDQVDVLAGLGVEAVTWLELRNLLCHDAALKAGVDRDLLQRSAERRPDDLSTCGFVTFEVELLERKR